MHAMDQEGLPGPRRAPLGGDAQGLFSHLPRRRTVSLKPIIVTKVASFGCFGDCFGCFSIRHVPIMKFGALCLEDGFVGPKDQ